MKLKTLITTLAAAVGLTTAAVGDEPRTISINFNADGSGRTVSGEYGIVPSSNWNNFTGASNSSGATANVSDGSTVTVKWWSHNVYNWDGATDNALKGYLDDGACGDGATSNGPHIGIKGIPFTCYDVIVYLATDTASLAFNPPAIGKWTKQTECSNIAYSYDGSVAKDRNNTAIKFGASRNTTAIVGQNVVYLQKGFGYTDLDIKGGSNANTARGGIAAVQIVERLDTSTPTISVNFQSGTASVEGMYGIVPSTNWVNTSGTSGTDVEAAASDGSGTAKVTYSCKNTWNYNNNWCEPALRGYLDDGNDDNRVRITVTDIPFEYYDVIVYQAADSGSYEFNPPRINGTWYSYDGVDTSTTDSDSMLKYGATQNGTASVGGNVVYVKRGFSGELAIKGAGNKNTARGGIAAIQIVKSVPYVPPAPEEKMATSFVTEGAPTEAYGVNVKQDLTAYGQQSKYTTEDVGQVEVITNATESSYTIFGGAGRSAGAITTDIWMEVLGGTFKSIFGGSNSDDWSSGNACSITGDIVLEVGGNTVTENVLGGNYKDGKSPTIDGNITVVVKDNAVVKGVIAGSGMSAHGSLTTVTGNTKVTVKNIQSDNSAGALISADSSDYIVGGGVYATNTKSREVVNGNTEVVIDIEEGEGDFVKNIVGGGLIPSGGSYHDSSVTATVGGNSSVTITAPETVKFTGNLIAGGSMTGGGDATVSGTATLTLCGGTFESKKISGGLATGTKTLAIGSDITLDPSVTVVEGFDALTAEEGTLTLNNETAASFTLPTNAVGNIVKSGAGALTLDQSVAGTSGAMFEITGGTLKFVITAEELAAGDAIALYNTEYDIDEAALTIVNEAGATLPGNLEKEGTTVKFTPTVAYYKAEITGDVTWSTKEGLGSESCSWINSPVSTITLTNTTAGATFDFDEAVTAATITVTGEATAGLTIKGTSLCNVTADALDFTNLLAGAAIDCDGIESELVLFEGAVTGNVTGENVAEGLGLIVNAAGIAVRQVADKSRTNPVDPTQSATFSATFFGSTDGDWAKAANWRTAQTVGETEYWMPTTYTPARSSNAGGFWKVLVDGDLAQNTEITVDTLEGYNIQYAFLNGVNVFANTLKKIQTDGTPMWIWVDESSSFTVGSLSDNANWGATITLDVAAADGIVFQPVFGKGTTLNYGFAGDGSVLFEQGISAGTHNLTNGLLTIGGTGFTGGKLNVTNDAAIAFTNATAALGATVTVAEGKTLTVKGAEGGTTLTVTGTITGGTVAFDENVTLIDLSTNRDTVEATVSFAAESPIVKYTEVITDDGVMPAELTLASGSATPTYKMFATDGTEKEVEDGKYDPTVSGKVAWFDFTFTNTLTSVGSNTSSLTRDTSYGLAADVSAYTSASNAIFTAIDGYMSPSYPTVWSASVYAKVPAIPDAILMAFGTKDGGSLALITGDTNKNEIILARTTGNSKYEKLATMKVPNAYTTSHLYSFCKTDKKINIYLDSTLWSVYNSETSISFGSGFQLGSLFNGIGNTGFKQYGRGYYDSEVEENNSTIGALRMYKAELGPNAIKALAEEFKYISPNGSYSRTLTSDAEAFWTADGQWKNDATELVVDTPQPESSVTLTGVATTKVRVNLADDTIYESITLDGASDKVVSIAASGLEGYAGKIKADGQVTVSAPVALEYNAIDITGVPLTMTENGVITFVLTSIDLGTYYTTTYIPLTGVASVDYASRMLATLPAAVAGRTAQFVYDQTTQTYGLQITVKGDLTATIDENAEIAFSELVWKMGEDEVTPDWTLVKAAKIVTGSNAILDLDDDATNAVAVTFTTDDLSLTKSTAGEVTATFAASEGNLVSVYAAEDATVSELPCTINGTVGKTGAGTLSIAIDRTFLVKGGTLKATKAGTATITVEEGATFDVNGLGGSVYNVVLNGGKVVNDDANIGDAKQVSELTLVADATIGGTGNFSIQGTASGLYSPTTINLDSYTLTKTGANRLALVNTTIEGTGMLDITEGSVYSSENTTFTNGVLKIGAKGSLLNRGSKTLTIAKIVGEEGALIWGNYSQGDGNFSDFTLEGAVTLQGGNYGTITLVEGSVLNAGEKRGLALAGAGTVNVQLTADEYATTNAVTVFTSGVDTVVIGTVKDADGNPLAEGTDYTVEGGVITPTAKASYPEWLEGAGEETKQKYDAWASTYDVTDPSAASKDAFLLNCDNTTEAVDAAKALFKITSITFDEEGKPVIGLAEETESYNGKVTVRGATTPDGDYTVEEKDWDETTKFFKAFLELVLAN